jgi:polyisoprenoid-binding protein YceI
MTRPALFAAPGLALALAIAPFAVEARGPFTSVPAEVQAGSYRFDAGHSKITWSINHLGFSTYTGQFAAVSGALTLDPAKPTAASLDVTVDTTSLGTLNPALDAHLRSADFLNVAAFPTATFRATGVKLTGERTALISGDLTLHGVTRPVVVEATFNQAGVNPLDKTYSLGFDGKAVIKRSEFGITAYVPAVGDEVTLTIEAELKRIG